MYAPTRPVGRLYALYSHASTLLSISTLLLLHIETIVHSGLNEQDLSLSYLIYALSEVIFTAVFFDFAILVYCRERKASNEFGEVLIILLKKRPYDIQY